MIRPLVVSIFILGVALAAPFPLQAAAPPTAANPSGADEEAFADDRLMVRNLQGIELGEIINFVVDTEIGKVAYALLDTGGMMAVEDLRLVPLNALYLDEEEIILNMDEKELANAPIPAQGLDSEEYHRRLSEYFGVAPYWEE